MTITNEFDKDKICARIDRAASDLLIGEKQASNRAIADLMNKKLTIKGKSINQENVRKYRTAKVWPLADADKFTALAEVLGRSPTWLIFGAEEVGMGLRLMVSKQEHDLLSIFKILTPDLQQQLIGVAKGMILQMPQGNVYPFRQPPKNS